MKGPTDARDTNHMDPKDLRKERQRPSCTSTKAYFFLKIIEDVLHCIFA